MKKRVLSILLILCMAAWLAPTVIIAAGKAAGKPAAIQLGTDGIKGERGSSIYYGTWRGSAVEWMVLDKKTNTGADGMFLLSKKLLGNDAGHLSGGMYFQNAYYYDVYYNQYYKDDTKASHSNEWKGSDAQKWCTDFAGTTKGAYGYYGITSAFSKQEAAGLIATVKSDNAYNAGQYNVNLAASADILNGDKVFFLSAEEAETYFPAGEKGNSSRKSSGSGQGIWWLRSPYKDSSFKVGTINGDGSVSATQANYFWGARPAFNLDTNTILFISAAVGGKAESFNYVSEYTGNEWKLTLRDAGRSSFSASVNTTVVEAGQTLSLNYSGSGTGANEYVSAMLADKSGNILCYGRIAHYNPRGTASLNIPSDLEPGSYTLKLFSEQYNGDKMTDYASDFTDIELTVVKKVEEQFDLVPGTRYYFDLSLAQIPGTVNGSLPDGTLHYVPFTYAGTVNAYVLNGNSKGIKKASEEAAAATDSSAQYGYTYEHSLFIADYAVTHTVKWDILNTEGLIFGKNYESGNISYVLRAPTVGSAYSGTGAAERGIPANNEWDTILNKARQDYADNSGYISNWKKMYSTGQDTSAGYTSYRVIRGESSARYFSYNNAEPSSYRLGFRPVLEVKNAGALGRDGLKAVKLNLGGGTVNGEGSINLVVKNGESFAAPAREGIAVTDPSADFLGWSDGVNTYMPGDSVPAEVTVLTAKWKQHEHCICANKNTQSGHTHTDTIWTAWSSTDSLPQTAGYYYLVNNINLGSANAVTADGVYICLNGKSISGGNTQETAVTAENNGTLVITDCGAAGSLDNITLKSGKFLVYTNAFSANTVLRIGENAEFAAENEVDIKAAVINKGKITGGVFSGTVDNEGVINGGTFRHKLTNKSGSINNGNFSGRFILEGGAVNDGEFAASAEIELNGGTVYGGIYYGNVKFGGADIKESAYRYVTFNTGGGSEINAQKILRGQKAAVPGEKPAKKGYIFGGWSAFDFTAPVLENTEITAQWTVCDHSGSTVKPTCTDSAVCSECGETIAAAGHQPKAGYMYDDDTHWRECAVCSDRLDEAPHSDDNNDHLCDTCEKAVSEHTGGTATCTDKAVCDICGQGYGEPDGNNHTKLEHFPAKEATAEAEGNIEYWYCSICGRYYGDAAAETEITKASTVTEKLPSTGDNGVLYLALLFIAGSICTVLAEKHRKNTLMQR